MKLNNIQYNLLTTLKRFKIYSSPILTYSMPIFLAPEVGILFNKIPKNNNFQGKPFHTPILGVK